MAIPARSDLVADLAQKGSRLIGALNRLAQESRLRLSRVERGIPDLPALLGSARQRLDDRAERALLALPSLVARRRVVLTSVERRLPDPRNLTAVAREAIRDRSLRLLLSAPGLVTARRSGLEMASQRLLGRRASRIGDPARPGRPSDGACVRSPIARVDCARPVPISPASARGWRRPRPWRCCSVATCW